MNTTSPAETNNATKVTAADQAFADFVCTLSEAQCAHLKRVFEAALRVGATREQARDLARFEVEYAAGTVA